MLRSHLAFLAFFAACAGPAPSERRTVEEFKVGVTLRADAERVLGPPQYEGTRPDGGQELVWIEFPEVGGKYLRLSFDARGRLAMPPRRSASGAAGLEADGTLLRPVGAAPPPCARNADCADGVCLAGTCR